MEGGEPQNGDRIGGRYRLDKELGSGGHGIVFSAVDETNGQRVAVKVLRQQVAEDPEYSVRLWREAQSLQALWGSSVVRVHGFGHDDGGSVYMVMELLEGETLGDKLADLESFGDRMNAFDVLNLLDPVARALHAAHTKGIIHRDVKPPNIFCVADEHGGGVRLMDFGLAKIEGADQLTKVGMVAGSPSYIAPEIWRAESFDHRADVYSLGAVVFRCFAGAPPFKAPSTLDLFIQATSAPRPKLSPIRPDLSPEIDGWVARALALKREDRYGWVSVMWNDLIRIVMAGRSPSAERARATFRLPGT